jgi:hypothetical protein
MQGQTAMSLNYDTTRLSTNVATIGRVKWMRMLMASAMLTAEHDVRKENEKLTASTATTNA